MEPSPTTREPRSGELFARASAVTWAWTTYSTSNEDEFFACCYADFLRARYERASAPEPDREGWWDEVVRFFRDLERAGA